MNVKDAIYCGDKDITRIFKNGVFFDGVGYLDSLTIRYGMTGTAYYNYTHRKWDFRPDGANIQFLVNRSDLYIE